MLLPGLGCWSQDQTTARLGNTNKGGEVRRAKGISMRKLITLCPLHKSSISEIENGKWDTHILTLKMLADVLNVDVKEFF